MPFSERSLEGELYLDHRASPGMPGRGSVLEEFPTKTCNHCGTVVIINPDRQRERAKCFQCHMYICDNCELERLSPGYVHRTRWDKYEDILRQNSISKG